jgi:nucleotide-binding universal stress UspA family protein
MAQLRDLSIVQLLPNAIGQRRLAEALIFGSGRPVLIMPDAADPVWNTDHIAVSWDGSQAATRAIHDAMDLLAGAETVTLLTALDDKKVEDGTVLGLISYLDRHGIKASHSDVHSSGIPIGKALQTSALDHGAGLLVMGAFGHSRIREFVLGGATRSVLDQPMLPILLSH